jgi:formylglycine-generating enzyme required for sulfatase activity
LGEAELKRLKQLDEEQRRADAEKARIEADSKVKQAALDKEIAELRGQLKVQSTSGTLDALAALADKRETLDEQLRETERKAAEEKAKRDAEKAALIAQERVNRKANFEARYAKYSKAAGSKFLSDEEKTAAWKAVCEEWSVAGAGDKPGQLMWNQDRGAAQVAAAAGAGAGSVVAGIVPGVAGKTTAIDLGGGVKLEMVWVPAGEFDMGSPASETDRIDSETQHRVTLSKGFWMGKYEVTQEQWERVMGSNPSNFKGARNPVEQVSWTDCQEFIGKVNRLVDGGGFRLPTEAEWEYACRAGTKTRFHTGDADGDLDGAGWYTGNSGDKTHPVGEKKANAFGLFDMHGNVWEWCLDWYGDYPTAAVTDPAGPGSGEIRVVRGGCWVYDAWLCRSAFRFRSDPGYRWINLGFRLARGAP